MNKSLSVSELSIMSCLHTLQELVDNFEINGDNRAYVEQQKITNLERESQNGVTPLKVQYLESFIACLRQHFMNLENRSSLQELALLKLLKSPPDGLTEMKTLVYSVFVPSQSLD